MADGRAVGGSVGWLVGQSVGWSVVKLVGRSIGLLNALAMTNLHSWGDVSNRGRILENMPSILWYMFEPIAPPCLNTSYMYKYNC